MLISIRDREARVGWGEGGGGREGGEEGLGLPPPPFRFMMDGASANAI